jgi:hypothetical protein
MRSWHDFCYNIYYSGRSGESKESNKSKERKKESGKREVR